MVNKSSPRIRECFSNTLQGMSYPQNKQGKKMQSKKQSIIESLTNTFTGTLVGLSISQLFCYGQVFISEHFITGFTWNINIKSNLLVTVVLTSVSIIRGYLVRRAFNKMREKYNEPN